MTRSPLRLATLVVLAAAARAPAQPAEIKAAADKANAGKAAIQAALSKGEGVAPFVRVDSFAAGEERVDVKGVFLDPGKTDPAKLIEAVGKAFQAVTKSENVLVGVAGVTPVPFADQPHVVLQLKANAAGGKADGVALAPSTFGSAGKLTLTGVADADAAKWLADEVAGLTADKRFGWVGGADKVDAAGIKTVAAGTWPVAAARLQKAFTAEAMSPAVRGRVRIDRSHLAYDAGGSLQIKLSGVWLDGGDVAETQRVVIATVHDSWTKLAGAPPAEVRPGDLLNVEQRVADPAALLQAAVAADPALDGTRVAPGMAFTAAGGLALAGVRPTFDQPAGDAAWLDALTRRLAAVAKEKAAAAGDRGTGLAKLIDPARGLASDKMTKLPSQQILAKLRTTATLEEEFLEDVFLRRLSFDAAGHLRLDGHYVRDQDKGRVLDLLRKAVGEYVTVTTAPAPAAEPPKGAEPPKEPAPAPAGVVLNADSFVAAGGGFADHLRAGVAADGKKFYGVVVQRGYFDPTGKYTVVGLIDGPQQHADMLTLITAAQPDPKWKAYFGAGPVTSKMTVMPMADLLARVRRVAPGHPACDGVAFDQVSYDKDLNLVFKVSVVGDGGLRGAEQKVRELMAGSTKYGPRLPRTLAQTPAGKREVAYRQVKFERSPAPTPPSPGIGADTAPLAGSLIGRFVVPPADSRDKAAAAEARRLIDVGLLHAPEESGIWYLSAYLHHQAGDHELVRRDLYRVALIEDGFVSDSVPVIERRYEHAAGIQGGTRLAIDARLFDVTREYRNGARPLGLDPR